jgi:transcriptional regulator with GAF, ATPase, and Fis domain
MKKCKLPDDPIDSRQEQGRMIEGELLDMSRSPLDDIIGRSELIQQIKKIVPRIAKHTSPVLIIGESGTGKELFANGIHRLSPRAGRPLVAFNCAAVPREIAESELFGHARGAFTGAHQSREGRFSLADGGSIFLDEIGEMELDIQPKLLRVLQEQKVWPLGARCPTQIDVRVISATNKDLEEEVKNGGGQFREDLFYRIGVIVLRLPPLRKHPEDIPLLVAHKVAKIQEGGIIKDVRWTGRAMDALCDYSWPGNIRELENVVERVLIMSDESVITESDVKSALPGDRHGRKLADTYLERRKQAFAEELGWYRQVLKQNKGNHSAAARKLGLPPSTLRSRMKILEWQIQQYSCGEI